MTAEHITIAFSKRLLEHPRGFHIHRMRTSIWLYLALLARLPTGSDRLSVSPADLARAMGLPEGTVVSWLGHLRRCRYLEARRRHDTIQIRIKRHPVSRETQGAKPARFFTVAKVEHALQETGHRDLLEPALAANPDPAVKRALAGALAVPAAEIRRSRTALFLYLLRRHTHENPSDDSRP